MVSHHGVFHNPDLLGVSVRCEAKRILRLRIESESVEEFFTTPASTIPWQRIKFPRTNVRRWQALLYPLETYQVAGGPLSLMLHVEYRYL